jgi:hypothetical protein
MPWTVRNVMYDIHKRLKDRSGHKELRKSLLARALDGLKEVARAADTGAQVDHDTIWVHFELVDIFLEIEEGGTAEAKKQSEIASDLARRLVEADPQSAVAQHALSVSHAKLGDVQMEMGDSKAALAAYQKSLALHQRLAKADPQSAQAQRDLMVSFFKVGKLEQQAGEFSKAADWYAKALDIPKRFAKPGVFRNEVGILESRLHFCRAAADALIDPAAALKQAEELRLPVLAAVTAALARQKKPDKAIAAADLLAANAKTPGHLYDAACVYALCMPLADKAEAKEKRAARAVELLRQALAKGLKDAAQLKKDTDLDALRERDDFKKFLMEVEAAARPKKTKEP